MANKKSKANVLRRTLESAVDRARKNTHSGDQRTKDLEIELGRIAKRVSDTLTQIKAEVDKSDSPDEDVKAQAKLERTMEILTSELILLSGVYHRQKDVNTIRHFLNEQKDTVQKSMYDSTGADAKHAKSLDGRIVELHELMGQERKRITRAAKSERAKFYVSISIALVSLSISIYALWLR